MNEIAIKIKCKDFNRTLLHLSHFFILIVKMSIIYKRERNIGYMLIQLINSLGVHRHS